MIKNRVRSTNDESFHDLCHTGNTVAAMTGTSLRDLMTVWGTAA